MDKKEYITPEMEITEFETEDVIKVSGEKDETDLIINNPSNP